MAPKARTATWATHTGDFYAVKAAVVSRKLGRGTVTRLGVTRTGEFEMQVLAKAFGVHGIAAERYPEGIIVEYRDALGIAVIYADKPNRMTLPPGTEVWIGETSIKTAGVPVWKAGDRLGKRPGTGRAATHRPRAIDLLALALDQAAWDNRGLARGGAGADGGTLRSGAPGAEHAAWAVGRVANAP